MRTGMPIELAPHNPYGLTLRSPVLLAAGVAGYGAEAARLIDIAQLGGIVTRTTTLEPRRAPHSPRLLETPAGVLTRGPWPNPGVSAVLAREAPTWATWTTPVIFSIAARTALELGRVAGMLEGVDGIAGIELSNTGTDAPAATQAVRANCQLPVLVKLPPLESAPLAELARAVVAAGAEARRVAAPQLGGFGDNEGWLCGPAVLPLTLRLVASLAAIVDVPLIGCGGIASVTHAKQVLAAGAQAVQVGSAFLADPFAVQHMGSALQEA